MTHGDIREGLPPRQHQTLAVAETHQVGSEGKPVLHIVQQELVALEPMEVMPYIFDATESDIESVQANAGCEVRGKPYAANPHFHVVNLALSKTLQRGERATLEYTMFFNYRQPPAPEYTRAIGRDGMEKLDITVRFDGERLPRNIWWAAWKGVNHKSEAVPGMLEQAELRPAQAEGAEGLWEARRVRQAIVPGTILGFKWEW